MQFIKAKTVLLAAAVSSAAPLLAHDPAEHASETHALPASAQGPAAVVDKFHQSLQQGDTNSAVGLLADDALICESGGVERSKQEYAAHHLGADAAFAQAIPGKITQRMGSAVGELAWIATEGRITGSYKGTAVDRVTAETMILRRQGTAWKIVHIHWSSAAAGK